MKTRALRRTIATLLLAGLATVGFVHVFEPDPGESIGGLGSAGAVQHVHETDPGYTGG
jgi:hypothetical protein